MWGLFSKDPTKDFPYENGERLGQIHLANKTVWTLHSGKHRTTGETVAIFSCDTKDGASQTQLDIARLIYILLTNYNIQIISELLSRD